jgi:hypothetical protein
LGWLVGVVEDVLDAAWMIAAWSAPMIIVKPSSLGVHPQDAACVLPRPL